MCGIAGIVQSSSQPATAIVQGMADALKHRGPDGEGIWTSPSGKAILGHRRLAIIDLSTNASQPMGYLNRYHIVFNGEIYNHIELKEDLQKKGYTFRTRSDTEVLLAAFDLHGIRFLEKLDGMFAFAIWDEEKKELTAARDRFGEKPFYFSISDNESQFYFASEPKALRKAGIDMAINEGALFGFLALNDADQTNKNSHSFYKNIFQLPPAHHLTVDCNTSRLQIRTARYWEPQSDREKDSRDHQKVKDTLLRLLQDSVRKRLRSDVPIGSSFSGGLDSASIAAVLHRMKQEEGIFSHQAFTAGFPGFEKDESPKAIELGREFNLHCNFVHPNEKDFADEIGTLIKFHEEPISSASVYAQYKVYELAARAGIKVLIDGQGADELLAGYDQYVHWYLQELIHTGHLNTFLKEKNALKRNGRLKDWTPIYIAAALIPKWTGRLRNEKDRRMVSRNADLYKDFKYFQLDNGQFDKPVIRNLNDLLRWASTVHGLPELLRYADRNSMAHGREVRLPFLQHELAGWLLNLPSSFKIREGYTKWILRKSMEDLLPASVVWNKQKIGFEPPQHQWMGQKAIRERIRASKEVLVKEKYLDPSVLDKNIRPSSAYSAENKDWRYMVAGILIE